MSKYNPGGDREPSRRTPATSPDQPLVPDIGADPVVPAQSVPGGPAGPAADPLVPSGSGPEATREPARILLLEDEAWDVELAQRLLTRAGLGYVLVVVDALDEFAAQLAEFAPDVIISDYYLQGFLGTDALKIVREHRPQVPFIFWSGVLGDETAVDLIKQGATDYILKDRPARLPSAVERALADARQRHRLAQIEDQLTNAQRLASLGRLVAAEQEVSRTRQMLANVRQEVAADPPE